MSLERCTVARMEGSKATCVMLLDRITLLQLRVEPTLWDLSQCTRRLVARRAGSKHMGRMRMSTIGSRWEIWGIVGKERILGRHRETWGGIGNIIRSEEDRSPTKNVSLATCTPRACGWCH